MTPNEFQQLWENTPGKILENPGRRVEVEKQSLVEKTPWVRILFRLRDTTEVRALVEVTAGQVHLIYYPDGRAHQIQWQLRINEVLNYVKMAKKIAPDAPPTEPTQTATPPTEEAPAPASAPVPDDPPLDRTPRKPTEPLFRHSTTATQATAKKLLLWPWLIMIGIVFAVLFAGLVIWAFARSSKTDEEPRKDTPSQGIAAKKSAPGARQRTDADASLANVDGGTNIDTDPNAPAPATVKHEDLEVTLACESGSAEILCTGFVRNIGNEDGDFYITGSDYPRHGWARTGNEGPTRIIVDAKHFQLGDRTHWNNYHVWVPSKSTTQFWFSYESKHPDASKTAHIDLDMMWGGNNSLGFDLPEVPINGTTYHSLDQ